MTLDLRRRPLLTQSGHSVLRIVATQNSVGTPVPPVVNPCCNCIILKHQSSRALCLGRRCTLIEATAALAAAWPLKKEIRRLGLAGASEAEPQEVTMSILGDIVSRIFRHSASPASAAPTGTPSPQSKPASPQAAPPATTGSPVDVAAIMDKLAAQSKEKLDWRKSIVDLMKLLKLDSSLGARKRLAKELGRFPPSLFMSACGTSRHLNTLSRCPLSEVKRSACTSIVAPSSNFGGGLEDWGRQHERSASWP